MGAARTEVTVFDLSDRTQIEIKGTDRIRFLHSFTSNDIKRLKPDQGCETFVTNLKGKVVAHVFVFCTEHSLWLDGSPGQRDAITRHLGKYVLVDDVQIVPRDDRGELLVTGTLAAPLLQLAQDMRVGDHITRETEEGDFDIRRVDLLGELGFLLSVPSSQVETVKTSMTGIGVAEGSRELFEYLRINAGYPQFGADITEDNLAQEVDRTKECISFDKGCYLGQETIARLDALGHTNQSLRRMTFESKQLPEPGHPVFDESGSVEVGMITSASKSLDDAMAGTDEVVALGMLKRTCTVGTIVKLKFDTLVALGRVR